MSAEETEDLRRELNQLVRLVNHGMYDGAELNIDDIIYRISQCTQPAPKLLALALQYLASFRDVIDVRREDGRWPPTLT